MTPAGLRRAGTLIVVLAGAVLPALFAPTAAQEACTAWFNGVEAERVAGLSSPLLLDAGETLAFTGTDPAGTLRAEVAVVLGPVTVGRAVSTRNAAAPAFAAYLDLAEVADDGVGLLRIRAATDHCTVEAWVRVGGRLPFTTLAGLIGAVLGLAGLSGLAAALIARRRWSPWVAAAAGAVTGAGGALLAQQFGRMQLSYWSAAACAVPTAAAGLGLAWLLRPRAAAAPAPPLAVAAPAATPAAPRAETAPPPPEAGEPYWCYVMADTEVLHLDDHTQVVATLRPGNWYLARREVGAWARVVAAPGVEGGVPLRALHREN